MGVVSYTYMIVEGLLGSCGLASCARDDICSSCFCCLQGNANHTASMSSVREKKQKMVT